MAVLNLESGERRDVPGGTLESQEQVTATPQGAAGGRILSLETGEPGTPDGRFDPRRVPDYREKKRERQIFERQAQKTSPGKALLIGIGRGFTNIGRGLGLIEPGDEEESRIYGALTEESPIATTTGEIIGESAPFVVPGGMAAKLPGVAQKVAAATLLGGGEAGIIMKGERPDASIEELAPGVAGGALLAAGMEAVFPVIGRLGHRLYRAMRGKPPDGAVIDAAGNPTEEFAQVLDDAGLTMDDLKGEAVEVIRRNARPEDAEQLARVTRFAQEGIQPSRAESMTKGKFAQEATEQRLLQSAGDRLAEPFRQFKLRQSEQIRDSLEKALDYEMIPEETGEAIVDALANRKRLLRTQKNALYEQAESAAKDAGGIPVFVDAMSDAVLDPQKLDDLAITAPGPMGSFEKLLQKYGIMDPTPQMVERGFQSTPLTIGNVESFRKALNAISRADISGAADVAIGPVKRALDTELDELGGTLAGKGYSREILEPLKAARKTVRQMKTEFSPQSTVGRLVGVKKDGVTPLVEASQVYNKLTSRAMPVENVRKTVDSLVKAGPEGKQALKNLQMTTLLDLINAGFGTKSRTIDGVRVFNPIAFRNQIEQITPEKLRVIFRGNKTGLAKINNIEKIAEDLTPSAAATPKGSAPVLMDLADKLGLASISGSVPGGGVPVWDAIKDMIGGVSKRREVSQAMTPEIKQLQNMIGEDFSNIARALGVAANVPEEDGARREEES